MLYLLMGCPGSGKSTWVASNAGDATIISRDKIRFSMIKEGEDYFGKEPAVFKEFIRQIQEQIDLGNDVYADATHLNSKSRYKTLINLELGNTPVCVIYIKVSKKTCLDRNAQRTGLALVPPTTISRMYNSIELVENWEKSITEFRVIEND